MSLGFNVLGSPRRTEWCLCAALWQMKQADETNDRAVTMQARSRPQTMPESLERTNLCTGGVTRALMATIAAPILLMESTGGAQAACNKRVYIHRSDWRGTCRRLRSYPDLNRIHCTLLDADNPGVRADMQRRFGDLAVPRTLISRSVVSGLDTAKIQRLCR